jgi:polysaccharide biosynthesis/export protein
MWTRLLRTISTIAVAMVVFSGAASAQNMPNLSSDQLEQLGQIKGRDDESRQIIQPAPTHPEVLTPAPVPVATAGTSTLEQMMSERIGHPVRLFGYNQVGGGAKVVVPQMGAVQGSYIVGPGDQFSIVLRGQENSAYTVVVDRNGQVTLPRLSPIAAAGRSLDAFRRDLVAAVHRRYVATEAFVSLAQLRQVSVLVSGEVNNPGIRIATGLSSPLDAIMLSGGIRKSGSLRNIQLIRGERKFTIDLYNVLLQKGDVRLINLQEGDRIFVPSIGATAAVVGYVRRPAIYELPPGREAISARELFRLGSGALLRSKITASIVRIMPDGKARFFDTGLALDQQVRDGEALIVKSAVNIAEGRVTLTGVVRTPGEFALDKFSSLHSILSSNDVVKNGAYMLFGFIDRINSRTLQHEAIPFSPIRVIHSEEDMLLVNEDRIHILTMEDVHSLLSAAPARSPVDKLKKNADSGDNGTEVTPDAGATTGESMALPENTVAEIPAKRGIGPANAKAVQTQTQVAANSESGATAALVDEARAVAGAGKSGTKEEEEGLADIAESLQTQFGKKLSDYRFTISGAVQKPGTYLAAPNTTLADVIGFLGGMVQDVDLSSFEITSIIVNNAEGKSKVVRNYYPVTDEKLTKITLQPYDNLVFRHVYSEMDTGAVSIEGQVRYPGQYSIAKGERISSLLARAGGLTKLAYPYGTIFLRRAVAQKESDNKKLMAADLRSQLFQMMMRRQSSNSTSPTGDTIEALQNLLVKIEGQPALGRVSIVANAKNFAEDPENDLILEPFDRIIIPRIPATVSVLGEVMRPGAFTVSSLHSALDYVDEAGGFTQYADSSRVIVVYPDGRSEVAGNSWLSFGRNAIPPGTVIVVARDMEDLSFHQFVVDTIQVVSQLATTAAALAVLTTNIN